MFNILGQMKDSNAVNKQKVKKIKISTLPMYANISQNFVIAQKQPPGVFCKKGVLKTLAKFRRKHLSQKLFFDKVAGLRPTTLLKKTLRHECFPVNFAKFLRMHFL